MITSAIPARLEFQCGHAALVSLPRIKGESSSQRNDRIASEKRTAQFRPCDFCTPAVVLQPAPAEPILMAADTAADEIILSPEVEKVIASATERLASESTNGTASPASVASATPEPKRRGRKPRVATVVSASETSTPEQSAVPLTAVPAVPERKRRGRPPGVKNGAAAKRVAATTTATTTATTPAAHEPKRRGRKPRAATTATAAPTAVASAATTPVTVAPKRRGRKPRAVVTAQTQAPLAATQNGVSSAKRNGVVAANRTATRLSFTVQYVVDETVLANDIGDALRQVQARGAAEVLAVTAN